jgi:hypothetical protein
MVPDLHQVRELLSSGAIRTDVWETSETLTKQHHTDLNRCSSRTPVLGKGFTKVVNVSIPII